MNNNTGELFEKLVSLMATLRSENGCPWDKKQTIESLRSYLIEEAYEVVESINNQNFNELKEELGDLLFLVIFFSQIAADNKKFTITNVLTDIYNKMLRRHPHVFGNEKLNTASEVLLNWEEIKRTEKKDSSSHSAIDGIPENLPSLIKAYRMQDKASRVGFDWDNIGDVIKKVEEEINELKSVIPTDRAVVNDQSWLSSDTKKKVEEEIGDIIFAIVNLARFMEVDAETSIQNTIRKFKQRFKYIEQELSKIGKKPQDVTLKEMDDLWNEAKEKK